MYQQQIKQIRELSELSPVEILHKSASLKTAKLVLSLDRILDRLGHHENSLQGQTVLSFPNDSIDIRFKTGYYLFMFLKLHQEVYQEAETLGILDRLSKFQQEALVAHFTGDENQFYLKHL